MRNLRFFLLIFCGGIIFLGVVLKNQAYHEHERQYADSLNHYKQKYLQFKEDSAKFINNIAPQSSTAKAYQSASQGVEVHLRGLSWNGYFMDNNETIVKSIREKYNAVFDRTISNIHLDPDFQDNGYPDFMVEIENTPSFYRPGIFSKILGNFDKREPKPYKSFHLNSCDTRKAVMDLWLVTFDVSFRIEPATEHSRNKEWKYDGTHPITRKKDEWSRNRREFKSNDNKYGNLAVFLEFSPKNNFYLLNSSPDGLLVANDNPMIGIGAVECIQINNVSESGLNDPNTSIGVNLAQGRSLPLYPNLDELKNIYSYRNDGQLKTDEFKEPDPGNRLDRFNQIVDLCKNSTSIADPSLFNSSKFSRVKIQNLGSWQTGGHHIFNEKTYVADYYTAKFLIHLFVLGEWVVKDENIIKFKEREPTIVTKPGIFDYIIPDFNIGIIGKVVGGLFVLLAIFIIISFLFPPLRLLINKILKGLIGN